MTVQSTPIEVLPRIFSDEELASHGCIICDADIAAQCKLCHEHFCADHLKWYCWSMSRVCPSQPCPLGARMCVLCIAKHRR